MKGIKVYQRPNRPAQVTAFLENLEPKFRDKLVLQLYRLSQTPRAELREPHYKHFSIERYQPLYEIRERGPGCGPNCVCVSAIWGSPAPDGLHKAKEPGYHAGIGAITENTGGSSGMPGLRSRISS